MAKLTVPQQHQLKIAKKTLKMSDVGAKIMGGMSKDEAKEFLKSIGWSDAKIRKLEEIKLTDVLEAAGEKGSLFTTETVRKEVDKLQKGIKAPWLEVSYSTLGAPQNVSILIRLSLEPKKEWKNGILHNSRTGFLHLENDGTLDMFQVYYQKAKLRKSKVKTVEQAIKKINDWITKNKDVYNPAYGPRKEGINEARAKKYEKLWKEYEKLQSQYAKAYKERRDFDMEAIAKEVDMVVGRLRRAGEWTPDKAQSKAYESKEPSMKLIEILEEATVNATIVDMGKAHVTYDKKTKRFTTEASDIRLLSGRWPKTIILRNPKTKDSRTMIRKKIDKDREGDVIGALYSTVDGITLYVYND